MDEAQEFAPSGRATPGRESTLRLVAQARKYGLGMLFATQQPKGSGFRKIRTSMCLSYHPSSPGGERSYIGRVHALIHTICSTAVAVKATL